MQGGERSFIEGSDPGEGSATALDSLSPASLVGDVTHAMMAFVGGESETYRSYAAELVRYATSIVGPDEALDVVDDAMLAVFSSPGWGDVHNQRAFLYRAVFNRAVSTRRSDHRRRTRERAIPLRLVAPADESSADARRMLADLTDQQRAVIYLTYWEDLGVDEVAELLGVSGGTVRKQLARARERLRRRFEKEDRS